MRQRPKSLKPKAKLSVAPKSPKNQSARVRDLEKRLAESLEQQTATSEILRVISSSPTDVQPVFETMAANAARLCDAFDATIFLVDGDVLRLVAHKGPIAPDPILPLTEGTLGGRVIRERRAVHVDDLQAETREYPMSSEFARNRGFRTILCVPLLRGAEAIGMIAIRRTEVRPFTDNQITLLQTFANQAVIAIENVRLFTELQEKNQALTEAHAQVTESLEQQTATSEILRVISSSPTDVRPVFDTIVQNARRLCGADSAGVLTYDGQLLHIESLDNDDPERADALRRAYPRPANREHATGRAILLGRPVQIPDVLEDPEYALPLVRDAGIRSVLAVPMIRDGITIGAIAVQMWVTPRPYSDEQIGLLSTFADQAVIAIENVRLFKELEARNRDLTATSDVLRVIASSPTDLQPVFDTIAERAMRLCEATFGWVMTFDGERLHLRSLANVSPEAAEALRQRFPWVPGRGAAAGRTIASGEVVHIPDVLDDPEYEFTEQARTMNYRSVLTVPLLHQARPMGVIAVSRMQPRPFSADHIQLLKTFADQAVIAIENVRLFNETKDALERQTATSEILRVISGSPTDAQPVFDAIVRSASLLCGGEHAIVTRYDGELLHLAAQHNPRPRAAEETAALFPQRPRRDTSLSARALIDARVVHVPDVEGEELEPSVRDAYRRMRLQALIAVPMVYEGQPIGVVSVSRGTPGPFSDRQIALLRTFADQAVIAIENVRLFTELQASNRELTTALDTQTATSDILRVISQSQTDVQPVFDAILSSAIRLMGAQAGVLTRITGDCLELAAFKSTDDRGEATIKAAFPLSLQSDGVHAKAIRDRSPINIAEAQSDARLRGRTIAHAVGYQSLVAVPMILQDLAVGTISATRHESGGFTDDEIALLQTFADQAVIAIENVRLFKELEARTSELTRSVNELTALGEVGQAISSTLDLRTVLSTIVARATQLSGTDAGVIYEYDEQREVFVPRATEHLEAEIVETMLATPVRKGEGATGRLAEVQEPIQVPDILAAPAESRVRGALVRAGYRALLAVPLVRDGHLLGGLTVIRKATGEFAPEVIELLRTFATQSALAIQNARLFREIEDKSRQLEAASQHKSEFLANMSHELRTPLNAIIGFSEVLSEKMFGELNEKQDEYLKDIYASGTHLLSLINDILDLSKIEAGRMELELTDFHLPTALDNALTLVRERAGRRSITVQMSVDERLGEVRADERKIRQVVLNLLSNAIKFTPEGGRIEVAALPKDGSIEVSVSDTGVGIAPEDQEAVFEEFRQVGPSAAKQEGTGLGLTLCRKFVELHGGRIRVQSEVDGGSTFTFTIPVRLGE